MQIKIQEYSNKYKSTVKEFIISILEGEFGHHNVERPDLDSIREYYQLPTPPLLAIMNRIRIQ